MDRGAVEKARGQGLLSDLVKDGAWLPLQPQMVLKLARIFQGINLRLAIRAERDPDALAHHLVGDNYAIPKVALRRGTRAHGCDGTGKQLDLIRGDMNRMHRCEVRTQNTFPAQQRDR